MGTIGRKSDSWAALTKVPLERGLAAGTFIACGLVLSVVGVVHAVAGEPIDAGTLPAIVIPMLLAGWQLATRTYRPLWLVLAAEAVIIVQVAITPPLSDGSAAVGLVALGTAGIVFVQRRPLRYVAGQALAVAAAQAVWHAGDGWSKQLVEAVTLGVAFCFAALLISWMRSRAHAEESRYRHLFDTAPTALCEVDFSAAAAWIAGLREAGVDDLRRHLDRVPDARRYGIGLVEVTAVNRAGAAWLGSRREPVLGAIDPTALPSGIEEVLVEFLCALADQRQRCRVEVSGHRRTGAPYRAVFSAAIPNESGVYDVSRVIASMSDVTPQHQASQRLRDLVRSKDEFIAAVSHELRTPLSVVVGLALELRDRYDDFDRAEARELIGMVASESSEVAAIVEDLLVAARDLVGAVPMECRDFDLRSEARSVAERLGERDGPLVVDLREQEVTCWGDPARVRQILRNLLVNARRYGGSRVRMVVESGQDGPVVEVRDSGEPLAEHTRIEIFDAYQRAHQDAAPQSSVGLGLTVSRELARRMGGDVTYAHDGRESVFRLHLASPPGTRRERPIREPVAVTG